MEASALLLLNISIFIILLILINSISHPLKIQIFDLNLL